MISPVEIVAIVLVVPSLIAFLLSQVDLWQRKEYRLDRLRAGLFQPEFALRLVPYALALVLLILDQPLLSIIVMFGYHTWRASTRGIFRPTFTNKAILVTALAAILFFANASPILSVTTLSADKLARTLLLIPFFVAISVFVANLIGQIRKQQIIKQARTLRASLPELKVIGITGSYGKTSTKHFLAQLLPDAVASHEHRNDLFPIAQDMLKQLKPDTKTYIVELGAYKRGEIAALAKLTQPTIGVITAIGNQHLATFGSQENIVKAKWELIDALPKKGIAVLNSDDKKIMRLTSNSDAPLDKGGLGGILYYSASESSDIYADQIKINSTNFNCTLHIKDESQAVTIPLAGEGALSSVLAAAAAAHAAGASAEDIFSRAQHLKPFPKTMQIKSGPNGSTIIDDSYSANEAGVIAAIKHLDTFPQTDKRIILLPIIELGSEAAAVHQRISQALAKSGAKVFVYGTANRKALESGYASAPADYGGLGGINFFTNPSDLKKQATANITSDSAILLEGRLPNINL